ncbi:MAG: hypothetical protein EOO62_15190 [Hymenobacter sp.]|nr:MAG: hypothetical protein EOO62_15190 [Hymenobacter sp.]
MQALMLITDSATLLPTFRQILVRAFPAALLRDTATPAEFVIDFLAHGRVYIEYYGCSLEAIGWDEVEIACIKQVLPLHQHVYSLAYRGIEAAKKVILHLANSNELLVDNDCGTLMRGADFVRKVLDEPTWYWFDDLQLNA